MNAEESRARIRANAHLNAFTCLTEESGEGTIVGVKDNVAVRGTVNSGGSTIIPAVLSADDAPVVAAMRAGGCIVVGKTNLHEWALGVTSNNPHFGPVLNPLTPDRIPGGSSGGSAAAVAAGLVDWALGTDTGGSIRIPAALCGVVGFKPTIGTFDIEGVVPVSRSLDTIGVLACNVQATAVAFEQMHGRAGGWDPARRATGAPPSLAVPSGWGEDLDERSATVWQERTAGLPRVNFPDRGELDEVGFTILLAEAAAFHRRWLETVPERYGEDVRDVLMRGLAISRARYVSALLRQSELRVEAEGALLASGADALLVPATRIVAPMVGAPVVRADLTAYTRPFNTTGQPVICLPATSQPPAVGIQLVGRHGLDAALLGVAAAIEGAWATE